MCSKDFGVFYTKWEFKIRQVVWGSIDLEYEPGDCFASLLVHYQDDNDYPLVAFEFTIDTPRGKKNIQLQLDYFNQLFFTEPGLDAAFVVRLNEKGINFIKQQVGPQFTEWKSTLQLRAPEECFSDTMIFLVRKNYTESIGTTKAGVNWDENILETMRFMESGSSRYLLRNADLKCGTVSDVILRITGKEYTKFHESFCWSVSKSNGNTFVKNKLLPNRYYGIHRRFIRRPGPLNVRLTNASSEEGDDVPVTDPVNDEVELIEEELERQNRKRLGLDDEPGCSSPPKKVVKENSKSKSQLIL